MTRALLFAVLVAAPSSLFSDTFGTGGDQFELEFVTVTRGDVPDEAGLGYGAVTYDYRTGNYEISRAMIEVYNALSGGPVITLADLTDFGGNGPNRPATGISWNEAARFVNWLNTSQGYSAAYKFGTSGANDNIQLWEAGDPGYAPSNPYRNSEARYVLPSADEWYRAAYYDPTAEQFWEYPNGSDTLPVAVSGGTAPGTAVCDQPLEAGFADVMNAGGLSPFGTMAQGGNAYEWTESARHPPNDDAAKPRETRGGHYREICLAHRRTFRNSATPTTNSDRNFGFRVVSLLPDRDLDNIPDVFETGTGLFEPTTDTGTDPDVSDTDGDGLKDGEEVYTYGTDPNNADTDGDGFNDLAEVQTGKDPTDPNETPDAVVEFHTAVEFIFYSENGATYHVEWSLDLEDWATFPEVITGDGNAITRFYSTRAEPKRFFRATKLAAP